MKLAPIALFSYNRPEHLQITLNHLLLNDLCIDSEITIFCDGPKNKSDLHKVKKVHEIAHKVSGFKKKNIVTSEFNKGLANSIITGVSSILQSSNSIIVLEDDIVVSNNFLNYMNSNLINYEFDEQVASIHGYCYPINNLPDFYFLQGADCWGWATWKRAWNLIQLDGNLLLHKLKGKEFKFNLLGSYNYTKMLRNQVLGINNSWAIRWHASMFVLNKLTLYPGKSLVKNIGNDGSGTNFQSIDSSFDTEFNKKSLNFNKIKVKESKKAYYLYVFFFYKRLIKKILLYVNPLNK